MDVPVRDSSRTEGADMTVIAEELGPQAAVVCVVGLGYVGLPVAVEFGKQRPTVGFDLATKKVERLKRFNDTTGEVPEESCARPACSRSRTTPARSARPTTSSSRCPRR